jgi:LemA protein
MAVAENYPELKANQNFMQLSEELSAIEEDIANSRKYYNGTVRELNTYLEVFPTNMVGAMFGIQREKMFEISDSERQNVKVSFND